MNRFKCPKCGHASEERFEECPVCGIIVAKYIESMEETRRLVNGGHKTGDDDPGAPALRAILKRWIWPIPPMIIHVWVLLTSDTIWGEKTYIGNRMNIYETGAGAVTLIAMVVLPLIYSLTFTGIFPFLVSLPGFHRRPSESEIGCVVGLARVFVLAIFYWNSYAILVSY